MSASRDSGSLSVDVNSNVALLSAIYLSIIGAAVFIVQPGFVQGLVEFYGFDEQQAGYIASAEIWGLALTTVVLALGGHNYSWQRIFRISICLFVAGNLASTLTDELFAFSVLRFITGLGSGGLVSLTFTIIGLTRLPDRNFGFLIMGVLTYGALGLWAFPAALALVGLKGIIIFLCSLWRQRLALPATRPRLRRRAPAGRGRCRGPGRCLPRPGDTRHVHLLLRSGCDLGLPLPDRPQWRRR